MAGYRQSAKVFEGTIPPSVWSHHEQAKANIYCSEKYAELFHNFHSRDHRASAIVQAWPGIEDCPAAPSASFIISVNGRHARIYGKLFDVDSNIFGACLDAIFSRHPKISVIHTDVMFGHAPFGQYSRRAIPCMKTQDYVIALPPDIETYQAANRHFMKRLKYKMRLFFREFPKASIRLFEGEEITRTIIHEIVEMNRERMSKKHRVPGIGNEYEERLFRLAQYYGVVVALTTGDAICAGTILFRSHESVFQHVISHNAKYDKYSPGLICMYLGIENFISSGMREYHFMWGDNKYKRNFGATESELRSYVILRSWASAPFAIPDLSWAHAQNIVSSGKLLARSVYAKLGEHVSRPAQPLR